MDLRPYLFRRELNYSSYSKYKARIRLTAKARYHFTAYTSPTDTWAGTHSRYSRTIRVR